MSMIERIAAFLKERDENVMPHEVDDDERRGSAKAILELMREPTEEMKEAGHWYAGEDAAPCFNAMINAALREETP